MFVWVKGTLTRGDNFSLQQIQHRYDKHTTRDAFQKYLFTLLNTNPSCIFASGALFIAIQYINILFDCLTGP
jgi:hypothetical protein